MANGNELRDLVLSLQKEGIEDPQRDPRYLAKQEEIAEQKEQELQVKASIEAKDYIVNINKIDNDKINSSVANEYFDLNNVDDKNVLTPSGVKKYRSDEEYDNYLKSFYRDRYDDYVLFNEDGILVKNDQTDSLGEKYKFEQKTKNAELLRRNIPKEVADRISVGDMTGFESFDQGDKFIEDQSNLYKKSVEENNKNYLTYKNEVKVFSDKINNIDSELEKLSQGDFKMDALDSPVRIEKFNELINQRNQIISENQPGLTARFDDIKLQNESLDFMLKNIKNKNSQLNDANIISKALGKDYSLSARASQAFEEFFLGSGAEFVGLTSKVLTELARKGNIVPGPASLIIKEQLDYIDDLTEGKVDEMFDMVGNYVLNHATNYNQKLAEKREVNLPSPITLDDIGDNNVSFGDWFGEAFANNSPSILVGTLGAGTALVGRSMVSKAAKKGVDKLTLEAKKKALKYNRAAMDTTLGTFFVGETGDKMTDIELGQRTSLQILPEKKEQLEKLDPNSFEAKNISQQIKDLERISSYSLTEKAFTSYAYGGSAAAFERLPLKFLQEASDYGLKYGKNKFKKEVYNKIPNFTKNLLSNVGKEGGKVLLKGATIEQLEELGTQVAHNALDIFVLGENKSITSGLDKDFIANNFVTIGAITSPKVAMNMQQAFASEFSTRSEVLNQRKLRLELDNIRLDIKNSEGQELLDKRKRKNEILQELALANATSIQKLNSMTGDQIEEAADIKREMRQLKNLAGRIGGAGKANANTSVEVEKIQKDYEFLQEKLETLLSSKKNKQEADINNIKKQFLNLAGRELKSGPDAAYHLGLYDFYKDAARIMMPEDSEYIEYADGEFNSSPEGFISFDLTNFEATENKLKEKGVDQATIDAIKVEFSKGANAAQAGNNIIINKNALTYNILQGSKGDAKYAAIAPLEELSHIRNRAYGLVDKDGQMTEKSKKAVEEAVKVLNEKKELNKIKEDDYNALIRRLNAYEGDSEEILEQIKNAVVLGLLDISDIETMYGFQDFVRGFIGDVFGEYSWMFDLSDSNDVLRFAKNFKRQVEKQQVIASAPEEQEEVKLSKPVGDQIKALVPQGTTKQQYDSQVIGDVYNDLVVGTTLNGLIRGQLNKFGVTGDNVFGKPINNFVEDVKQQLFERSLTRFNPETNDDLGGFVVSELQQFRIGDVVNRYRREQAGSLDVQVGETGSIRTPIADEADLDIETTEAPRSELKQGLRVDGEQFVDQKIEDEIEANTIEIVEGVTPETNDKDFKTFVKDAAQQKSFKSVKGKLKNFDKFLEDNINVLFGGKNLPIATLVAMERRTPAANRIFTGEPTRLTTQAQIDKAIDEGDFYVENEKQGPSKYPRKKPTIEQVKKFFFDVGASTKGTRKDGLVNAISFSLFRDIVPSVMNRANIVQEDIAKVSQKLIVDPRVKFSKAYKNGVAKQFNLKNYYDTDTMPGVNKYIADIPKLVSIFEDGFLNKTILVNASIIPDPMLREYARAELDKIPELKIRNTKYTKTKFSSSLVNKSSDKQVLDLNKRNTNMFMYMWGTINKAIQKDKSIAVPLLHFFTVATNEGTHPHRLGAPLVYIDKSISSYYFEHALQNVKAWRLLIETSLKDNKNNTNKFDGALKSLMNNYKLIAISKKDNTKLDKSSYVDINGKKVSFKDEMGEIDGKEWNIFNNFWWQRYYNEIVGSMDGGISTSLISVETGKTISEELGIDEKGRATNKNIETSKQKAFNKNPKSKFSKAANIPKLINDLNNYDKALRNARNLNAPKKGISIFDFDDTLATSKSKVIVTVDGKTKKITPAEFAKQHSKLEEQGAQFDFSEFNKVVDGKPGPLAAKLKKAIDKFGNKDVFVLTARPQASAQAIYDFLKGIGLEVPLQNITGLEDGTPQAKANWVIGKAGEGYNDFYFTDDVYKNVKAVQEALEVVDVKSKTRLAYSDRVKKLDRDFNDIIEAKTGIAAEKEYGKTKAEVVGANKGKFTFFIPPSAEDFVGLLYNTLSKGKLGDSQMAWYKKNLLDPYASAMSAISRERISLMEDYKALKKQLGVVPKDLNKKIPGDIYTNEQAVRVYTWNKQGMTIPGLSKADLKELTDYIEGKPELKVFGDQLIAINKDDGYAAPTSGWLAGTTTTDIMRGLGTTKRAKHLQQWQQNVDIIFSEKNLNKLEAANGKPYRVALEGILQRMKTGRNRSFTGDSMTGKVTDWLTNSIGTIMFFNTRSALLQTISAINFVNFTDNNIFKAGKAYANQKQFWKDFMSLMNSEFLVDRRRGLRINVNEADIANMANESGARGVVAKMLEIGFLPTQIADSFAIASGGATFYRNRINTYKKQGLSDQQAEEKAFNDFREIAEESQQSSRPDRISQQQAGPLGRIILAFANTPMQYARLIKKAASDLKNRRGDVKTNISKIIYYGFVQNLIFNALQQAIFAIGFGNIEEEEDEKEKYLNTANSMVDSLLRGVGIAGAFTSVGKNIIVRVIKESQKKNPKYEKISFDLARISPPISSKLSRLNQAGRAFQWQKEEMREKGFAIDNPALMAGANVISAATNVPVDRLVRKANNVNTAVSQDLELWERFALLGGWQAWELGIDDEPKKSGSRKKLKRTIRKRKRIN